MTHDWVFEVLADLESYALHNDLPGLAERLSEAARTAAYEMAEDRTAPTERPRRPAAGADTRPGD